MGNQPITIAEVIALLQRAITGLDELNLAIPAAHVQAALDQLMINDRDIARPKRDDMH